MEIKRLRTLATEIFQTLNNINPSFMKDILIPREILKSDLMTSLFLNITSLESIVTKV